MPSRRPGSGGPTAVGLEGRDPRRERRGGDVDDLKRLWCVAYLAGRKSVELVTQGPYSLTRNPLYFFSLLGALGVGLATETFTLPALILSHRNEAFRPGSDTGSVGRRTWDSSSVKASVAAIGAGR